MPKYTAIIGLEVHVELKTKTKMFCACANNPESASPNTNICAVCLAEPGSLPVPNQTAVEWAVKIGRALGCKINEYSKFDRKHYFYPDLPKGYQISQYDEPIAEHGQIILEFVGGKNPREIARIGITRAHLEEDTAKLTHGTDGNTLVNFNRAGVPLVEIVTDPDFNNALEAKTYCQELQSIFRYLGVSDADMEKGQMRCEANVSVQEEGKFEIVNGIVKPIGNYQLNNKVEVKNINSFRAVEKAIEFEIKRQTEMLEKGESWVQQTRGWNDAKGETIMQRTKETSADYRYFPEPDIPPFHPLKIAGDTSLPELPTAKRRRFHSEYGFSYADAEILSSDRNWADFAENVYSELLEWIKDFNKNPLSENHSIEQAESSKQLARLSGGYITTKLAGAMAERKIEIKDLKIKPENFAELIALVFTNQLNSTNAQKVLVEMLESGVDMDPTHIMQEKGYGQVSDEGKLNVIIDEVIKNYPTQVEQFKAGKEPILQFLKGMVMRASEGSADPNVAEKMLREKLK